MDEEQSARNSLLQELGGIPLAIVQAGSFIGCSNLGIQKFLDLLHQNKDQVLLQLPNAEDNDTDKRGNIRTTWKLSFDQLLQATGERAEIHQNAA